MVLDGDAVLSGLAALDGGAIDEILTRSTDDNASQFGGEVGGAGVKAKAGKNRGRKVEEEMRRRRTEHSAAASLIDRLLSMEAVGIVEGAFDEDVAAAVSPGDALLIDGEFCLHPVHQADSMLREFIRVAPKLGQTAEARELKQNVLPTWDTFVGTGQTARVIFDVVTSQPQVPRVIAPVATANLQVSASDAAGFGKTLAQVDRVVAPDDCVLAVRVLHNAAVSTIEREAIEAAARDLTGGMAEIGIPLTEDDIVMRGPLVVLRPLCIWR